MMQPQHGGQGGVEMALKQRKPENGDFVDISVEMTQENQKVSRMGG